MLLNKTMSQYIIEATRDKNNNSIMRLIQMFEPLIKKNSKNNLTGDIDEDLKSTIIAELFERIKNFKVE